MTVAASGLRVIAAVIGLMGAVLAVPLIFLSLLSASALTNPNDSNLWVALWGLAALALCLVNALLAILTLHRPRREVVVAMAGASVLALVTCPFLWAMLRMV